MLDPERYVGKPFLRFLECYVLKAIGELSSKDEQTLIAMTPKLRQLYQAEGTWDQIVASQMELDDSIKEEILEIWIKNRENVRALGENLIPQDFAEAFVDGNFPHDA